MYQYPGYYPMIEEPPGLMPPFMAPVEPYGPPFEPFPPPPPGPPLYGSMLGPPGPGLEMDMFYPNGVKKYDARIRVFYHENSRIAFENFTIRAFYENGNLAYDNLNRNVYYFNGQKAYDFKLERIFHKNGTRGAREGIVGDTSLYFNVYHYSGQFTIMLSRNYMLKLYKTSHTMRLSLFMDGQLVLSV